MGIRRDELSERVKAKVREFEAEVREMLYGQTGCPVWGTRFAEIESMAMSVGEELSRQLMAAAAGGQHAELPPEGLVCNGEQAVLLGTEPRPLDTEAGPIEYLTTKAYLLKSRRDFFPSGDGSGDGH